jgi:chemotaxis protein methyltransferase CheR
MAEVRVSPALFSIFSALVEERVGLAYSLGDKSIFEGKLLARAAEAGFESPLDYYYYLRYDDPGAREFQALVQTLVVHETFFFREFSALRVAVEHVIAPLVAQRQRPRIWCAACSTGEEPLTVAMQLADMDLLQRVELVASDISSAAIERAKSGAFGRRAVRAGAPSKLMHYLTACESGYVIAPELLAAIDWRCLNLLDRTAVQAVGSVDLILCRNVLIYFRDETARKVVATLSDNLKHGGVLLVGVSESLMRYDSKLVCEEQRGAFMYKKGPP